MGEGVSEDPPSPSLPFRQPPGSIRSAPDQGGPQRRRQRGVSPAAAQPRVEAGFASQRSGEAKRPGSGTSARGLGRRPGNVAGGFRVLVGARGGRPGAGSGAAGLARPPGQQRFGGWGGWAAPWHGWRLFPGGPLLPEGPLIPGAPLFPGVPCSPPRAARPRAPHPGCARRGAASRCGCSHEAGRGKGKSREKGRKSGQAKHGQQPLSSLLCRGAGFGALLNSQIFFPPAGEAPPGPGTSRGRFAAFAAPSFPPAPRELCFVGS